MSYSEHYPLTEHEEAIALATCEAIIKHLKDKAPNRTLTARALINQGMMEQIYG